MEKSKDIPLYTNNFEYAEKHSETEVYRASHIANIDCRNAIETAINDNYAGYSLDTDNALKQVLKDFSMDRIAYVLAATIQLKNNDGRITRDNKEWAKIIPMSKDYDSWGGNRKAYFIIDAINPGLVDLLVNKVRKEQVKEQSEKKPSVVEKLSKPLPVRTGKNPKSKEQEL